MSNDVDRFLKDNPGIKLGEDVMEEIPVKKNSFDPKTNKVFSTYQLEKVQTRYVHAPKETVSCKEGGHLYRIADPKRWMFVCTRCPFARRAFPTTHKFIKGQLINKATNQPV